MNNSPINIDPETMSGTPVFSGTRVPIQTLFDYIEGGNDVNEFLDDFPSVSKETAIQVLEMAKNKLLSDERKEYEQSYDSAYLKSLRDKAKNSWLDKIDADKWLREMREGYDA